MTLEDRLITIGVAIAAVGGLGLLAAANVLLWRVVL